MPTKPNELGPEGVKPSISEAMSTQEPGVGLETAPGETKRAEDPEAALAGLRARIGTVGQMPGDISRQKLVTREAGAPSRQAGEQAAQEVAQKAWSKEGPELEALVAQAYETREP